MYSLCSRFRQSMKNVRVTDLDENIIYVLGCLKSGFAVFLIFVWFFWFLCGFFGFFGFFIIKC